MDPQLEEYRRKQRERANAQRSVAAQQSNKFSWSVLVAVGFVVVLAAVMYQQNIPNTAVGQSLQNTVQGTCPKPTGFGVCVEDCSSHSDCAAQGKLCCSNGCGHVCMDPEKSGDAQKSRVEKCTLMVSLVGKEGSDAVKQVVPTPSNTIEASALGILILEYNADRVNDCCVAKDKLESSPEIAKSVEFDGPPPACAAHGGDEHIEVVEDGPEFIDPDWKENQERRVEDREPRITGGWSDKGRVEDGGLSEEHMDLWDKVLEKHPTHKGHDLQKLGKPISVRSQVVAGVNYKYGFKNDAVVNVFHQAWTDTLEVTSVKIPSEQE